MEQVIYFSPESVLFALTKSDAINYIFKMQSGDTILVNIDDALEAMLDCGKIKKCSSTVIVERELKRIHFYQYKDEPYEFIYSISEIIDVDDIYFLLNENLIDYKKQ